MEGNIQLNPVSDDVDLLLIDLDLDVGGERADQGDGQFSRNVLRKQRNWERQVAAKKSRRKEEKERRKLNRLTEKVSRLAGQIRRLYGSNKKARRPFHVFLTDLTEDSRIYRECIRMNEGFLNYKLDIRDETCLDLFPTETIVYLTPDAEEALQTLDPNKVYVLGGLVDESVQKTLSLSRARALSVQTARLPIDEFMTKKSNDKNFHSKILAINQVFDILLTFGETGSWTKALQAWFPLGKGYVVTSGCIDEETSSFHLNNS
ncbi:tRNA methyltransferase 10 homolog B isoform 2-T2 [Synchiropus picturatus]